MTSACWDMSFVIVSYDSRTECNLGVILHVHFYTPRWNLEGFCQALTLKTAKCSPLTRSQPCLSPSHSNHSPTPLTPSQSGRPSLNTRVDEAWLIETRKSWTAAQRLQVVLFFLLFFICESVSDENEKNGKKQVGLDFLRLLSLIWVYGTEPREKPTCCENRLFIKISSKALFGSQCGWWKDGVKDTFAVLSLPVLHCIWYRL